MEKLNIIKTVEDLNKLKKYLINKDFVALDTETTGILKSSKIIGFSVCAEENTSFYITTSFWDGHKLVDLETAKEAEGFFKSLEGRQRLILHNAVFDMEMILLNYGVNLMKWVHTDTMVLSHLIDENRKHGLKELGVRLLGDDAKHEQMVMKESIVKNGGKVTKKDYELYKADSDLIALYGAKDALLTYKLFLNLVPQLYEQNLDNFFYNEESMPLLRGPTFDLNTSGLKVDTVALKTLQTTLETSLSAYKQDILKAIHPHVRDKYPGTNKRNQFNISASQQMSWLLYEKLGIDFNTLTEGGREICHAFELKVPYSPADKRAFREFCKENLGRTYGQSAKRPKKVGEPWKYMQCDKGTLQKFTHYKWIETLLKYYKDSKLLSTYVKGIQERCTYNIIHPGFLQIGTTSGRYSSRNPNFQNLPRDDKRVKECIVARPGHVFVGADYSQLEPRVFASVSQDPTLMACFAKGEDFYSVVGAPIYEITDCSMIKDDPNSFAKRHPDKRTVAKQFALATPYGTSAWRQSRALGLPQQECQKIIDRYFASYPHVELMMLDRHKQARTQGVVYSLYGRPRRMPEAKNIDKLYGKNTPHGELPYEARNLLNLAMNHCVQSSAASIVNRAAIRFWLNCRMEDIQAKIVLQVHDELVIECLEEDAELVACVLKDAMENTVELPGVILEAKPVIGKKLSDLK